MDSNNSHYLSPKWNNGTTRLNNTWQSICNIDQFRWLSRADVLRQLKMAVEEIGIRYVRAAAMYSPEMRVWNHALVDWRTPIEERPLKANWQLIDISIEGLLETGLKPIYTTCFTPVGMTAAKAVCWPDKNSIGMPFDLNQWGDFVASGIQHHIDRFGINEVRSWYFECWNEPNLRGFFDDTKEEFFRLWSTTWKALKSVDSQLRFGGPSTARGEWIADFLDFTEKDKSRPDYLISHIYNNDSDSLPTCPFDGSAADRVNDSPRFAAGVVRGVRKELDARHWKGKVHWNEWGRSWLPHDPVRETGAIDAAFIVKTMAEISQEADEFAYWCISDIYDQVGFQDSEFQGNYGMLSLHGLRKPAWFAHMLLNRLGEKRVEVEAEGDSFGAIVTNDEKAKIAVVYAYPAESGSPTKTLTAHVEWPFELPHLTRIGASENNIFHTWQEMARPAYPTFKQLESLRATNVLIGARPTEVSLQDHGGKQFAVFKMDCPGVAVLELRKS